MMGNASAVGRTRNVTMKSTIRLGLIAFIMMLAFSCGALVQASARTNTANPDPIKAVVTQTPRYEVSAGDMLWTIARDHAPKHVSTRQYVDEIMQLNNLSSSDLKVGQLLQLP